MNQAIKRSIKSFLKQSMATRFGRRVLDFVAMCRRSYLHAQVGDRIRRSVFVDSKVIYGPFKGMEFPNQDWPKMLGSYEDELHEVIEIICAQGYEQIIDIGAAEGYYAVGFAMRLKAARIYAYEMDPPSLQICREMIDRNGLKDRVILREKCEPSNLAEFDYSKRTLIFCDVDSYELMLLDPSVVPALKQADILVETHDFIIPNITTTLKARFAATHDLTIYREERKDHKRYPKLAELTPFEQEVCLNEDRISADIPYVMEWFHLVAK
jgi:predicted O-methyltransferase YrrM